MLPCRCPTAMDVGEFARHACEVRKGYHITSLMARIVVDSDFRSV
jgi:hypothetical protein